MEINKEIKKKHLLLIGGSGFIGSAIGEFFSKKGWEIRILTRSVKLYQTSFPCHQILWDGKRISPADVEWATAVINLAGQGIADQAWTSSYRQLILSSRLDATCALAHAIAQAKIPPEVVIQASAIGFFGMQNRRDDCDEYAVSGKGFLAEVCNSWENSAKKIASRCRLVYARIGLVLGWEGGALPQLWDIYASGLGSVLGSGKQWMNWIHLEDVVRFFYSATELSHYEGIYNLVASENRDNHFFHQLLASQTPSLSVMKTPACVLKTLMGERSGLLLTAPKVISKRLQKADFKFNFPDLQTAFHNLLAERSYPYAHYIKIKQWIPVSPDMLKDLGFDESLNKIDPLKFSKIWCHRYFYTSLVDGALIEERMEYQLPLFPLGELALPWVKKNLHERLNSRKEHVCKQVMHKQGECLPIKK